MIFGSFLPLAFRSAAVTSDVGRSDAVAVAPMSDTICRRVAVALAPIMPPGRLFVRKTPPTEFEGLR